MSAWSADTTPRRRAQLHRDLAVHLADGERRLREGGGDEHYDNWTTVGMLQSSATGRSIYTVGHSTRTLENLVTTLQQYSIDVLCDIRTTPRSRHVPQFNMSALELALPRRGVDYVHLKELGGLRHRPQFAQRRLAQRQLSRLR